MPNSDATDTTYEMASAHIAVAAPTAPTRPPPRPGPVNWANACSSTAYTLVGETHAMSI
jgi:hypothetical protein